MINNRDSADEIMSSSKYNIPYNVGECLENKENPEELIKIFGYFIDETGTRVYINHNVYSSDINDCEIIKLEELNSNWVKTSKVIITNIPSVSKTNIGLSKMIDEMYGHLEVTDKGVTLVKKIDSNR